jgi:hypothetical protein
MVFLENPKNGWVSIVFGDYSHAASYLTDVPFDCLDAMIYALQEGVDFCVSFEGEDQGDIKVIADNYTAYVIEESDEPVLRKFDVTKLDIAKALCNDIENELNEWAFWDIDRDEQEEANSRVKRFIEKLATLKGLIALENTENA